MTYDAVVVGSGPNGMTAAIELARAGLGVKVYEAASEAGGGTRSAALTLPDFVHDLCSAVHPLAVISPAFLSMPLAEHGLKWIHPPLPLAHPLDGGRALVFGGDLARVPEQIGADGARWQKLFEPWVRRSRELFNGILAPFHIPHHPLLLAGFGLKAVQPAVTLANKELRSEEAKALFAGMAAHSILPLDQHLSSAVALVLAVAAHTQGWPIAAGGSQRISDALGRYFRSLGGEIALESPITALAELPKADLLLFDVAPRTLAAICGPRLPARYVQKLLRFRHGPGVFKLDLALAEAVPWKSPLCRQAATLHLGGTLAEIARSERTVFEGGVPEKPFVLAAQPSLFDSLRAPEGRHTLWAYCHVPAGSTVDMTERIEDQIERFAPGFRDLILARHIMYPADLERRNPNYVGGDISGGIMNWRQLFARPVNLLHPYCTPAEDIFICSASTPPGAGVHGMCGYHAARAALARFRRGAPRGH